MIEFDEVSLMFGAREVLRDVSFSIGRGEIFAFIGPSGAGKTSILRLMNLIIPPTRGSISLDGIVTTSLKEQEKIALRRRMSMVFQKPVPLRGDVFENVATGLHFRGIAKKEIKTLVTEALDLVGLNEYEGHTTATLSGGEMQRVAIARAVATCPDVLLLDEPTANLDPIATETIERLITRLREQSGTTIVLSTHDMIQGQRIADRIAVMIDGSLGQIGTSWDIFYRPANRIVAAMVGVDNIYRGRIVTNNEGLARVDVNGIQLTAPTYYPPGTEVTLYIRPEDITIHAPDSARSSARNELSGQIIRILPIGPLVRIGIDAGLPVTGVITRRSYEELGLAEGTSVSLSFKASSIHVT